MTALHKPILNPPAVPDGAAPLTPSAAHRTSVPSDQCNTGGFSQPIAHAYAKSFAHKIVEAAHRGDWADYVNLCERAAEMMRPEVRS